ncbi:type II toxin-antitoxin system PemK/MazF family toxin [Halanaerobiaceae bacterium Z-7014]|uniref:mRNA interferase n=1 Tax=Halonatronomonas betaini TaxID=2778430 RepID=A0A931AWH2_9FIRM|nr:type II toxin-antitoxin system PemK/MazF family toxin [Halonatronomonas betaini]MBF8438060.1 type II toxin-antitoxin system PemK/MazF family toxin [Halonatronomonas betaini]
MDVFRGDVFYAKLDPAIGSEQKGTRPVVIIQNDIGNRYSPTVIVSAITSKIRKAKLPTHVEIEAGDSELDKDSVILLEQIRTLDKRRLERKITRLAPEIIEEVNKAIEISLGLVDL